MYFIIRLFILIRLNNNSEYFLSFFLKIFKKYNIFKNCVTFTTLKTSNIFDFMTLCYNVAFYILQKYELIMKLIFLFLFTLRYL